MKTITTLAALFAAILSFNASAATPQTGRVDFSDRAGIERPMEVKYLNGRVDPGDHVVLGLVVVGVEVRPRLRPRCL